MAARSATSIRRGAPLLALGLGLSALWACTGASATGAGPTGRATALPTGTIEPSASPTISLVPKATASLDLSPAITPHPTPTPAPTAELPNLIVYTASVLPSTPTCQTEFRLYWGVSNPGGAMPHDTLLQIRDVSGGVQRASIFVSIPTLAADGLRGGMERLTLGPAGCGEQHQLTVEVDPTHLIAESNETDNSFTFTYTLGTIG